MLLAVQENYAECVQMLIDAGANPRAKNHDNDTAVLLAAQYNAPEALAIVLKAGADPASGRGGLAGARRMAESEANTKVLEMLDAHETIPTDQLMAQLKDRVGRQAERAREHKDRVRLNISLMKKAGLNQPTKQVPSRRGACSGWDGAAVLWGAARVLQCGPYLSHTSPLSLPHTSCPTRRSRRSRRSSTPTKRSRASHQGRPAPVDRTVRAADQTVHARAKAAARRVGASPALGKARRDSRRLLMRPGPQIDVDEMMSGGVSKEDFAQIGTLPECVADVGSVFGSSCHDEYICSGTAPTGSMLRCKHVDGLIVTRN